MRTLPYFLVDDAKQKARVHQLDFIVALLQAKFKNKLFVNLDSRYADLFEACVCGGPYIHTYIHTEI